MTPRGARSNESGYAMLMVFVLAAAIAISLYMEMPREMFERTREREQLLIDRGEQYSLAVRRYYVKFGRFPTKMDDLDNTNNMRFLRRHYKDPMTGEDDWRIIHEAGGVLTDSLVHPMQQKAGQNGPQSFGTLTSSLPFGSTPGALSSDKSAEEPSPMAWGLAARPSDRGPLGSAHGGVSPDDGMNDLPTYADNGPAPSDTNPPADQSAAATDTTENQNPDATASGAQEPNAPANPGQVPGTPANQAAPVAQANSGVPGGPSLPGTNQQQPMGSNDVADMIRKSLQTARPLPGAGATGTGGLTGGGIGIAGVASKSPYRGIKTYNDRSKYKEWEFVLDLSKLQQQQGAPGQNAVSNQQPAK